MFENVTRRTALKAMGAGFAATAMPAIVRAEDYPIRPIIMVNPYSPGGYVDNISRALAPRLSKIMGQPISVINTPGADGLLGHEYFLKQPDDGYNLLADSVNSAITNVLVQNAPFKFDDFWMINLPARDYTLMATSIENENIKSIDDVVSKLKQDPQSLSIGIQPATPDYVNLVLFCRAAGIDKDKLRVVTFDGGGPVRTSTLGGVVDVGLVGGLGFLPLADQIRPLLTFDDKPQKPFDSPSVREVKLGQPLDFVFGSLRGFCCHKTFKDKYPDRYAKVLDAHEKMFKDPDTIAMLDNQQLASTWFGPEDSNEVYKEAFMLMQKHVDLLQGI